MPTCAYDHERERRRPSVLQWPQASPARQLERSDVRESPLYGAEDVTTSVIMGSVDPKGHARHSWVNSDGNMCW